MRSFNRGFSTLKVGRKEVSKENHSVLTGCANGGSRFYEYLALTNGDC